jgi:hypothetical protein
MNTTLYCEEDIDDIDPLRNPLSIFSNDMDFEYPMPNFASAIPMNHDTLIHHPAYTCIDTPKALFAHFDSVEQSKLCMWTQVEDIVSSTINFITGRVLFHDADGSQRLVIMELDTLMYEQRMLNLPTYSRYVGHVAIKNDNTMMMLNPQQWFPTDPTEKKTIEENIAVMTVPLSRAGVVIKTFRLPHKVKLWCHYNKLRVVA